MKTKIVGIIIIMCTPFLFWVVTSPLSHVFELRVFCFALLFLYATIRSIKIYTRL